MAKPIKMRVRTPWWEFRPVLVAREPFDTYGALRGIRCDSDYVRANHGHGSGPYPGSIDYAVYSYETPIAWHLAATDEWVVTSQRFSPTTDRHQSRIQTALSVTDEQYRAAHQLLAK